MSIDVVETHWFKLRCSGRSHPMPETDTVYQCDDHIDHFGSHHHAIDDKVVFWPSEADIEEAKADAEFNALTKEQVMLTLTGGDPEKEAEVKEWASASAKFIQSGFQMRKEIDELKKKLAATTAELAALRSDHKAP